MLFANVCAAFIRLCHGVSGERRCLGTLGVPGGSAHLGCISFANLHPLYVGDLDYAGVPLAGHALRAEFGGRIVFVVLWEFTRQLGSVPLFMMASFAVLDTAGSCCICWS